MDYDVACDGPLWQVVAAWREADPDGSATAMVLRETFDQIYDGVHTGRYRWEQLNKTEKTHFGTLIELNLRRRFRETIADGDLLDFAIVGHEIDCKYSQRLAAWMIPPEARGQLLLGLHADDGRAIWSLGVVRAHHDLLSAGTNRDAKTTLNSAGRSTIVWVWQNEPLPANVLLSADQAVVAEIMSKSSGQQRVNELFRRLVNRRISRSTVATVAQQADYMKRVRDNGGARSQLRAEGIIILGGDYKAQVAIAEVLGAQVPRPGEFVSLRVAPATPGAPCAARVAESWWRLAMRGTTWWLLPACLAHEPELGGAHGLAGLVSGDGLPNLQPDGACNGRRECVTNLAVGSGLSPGKLPLGWESLDEGGHAHGEFGV